ncbi:TetR/AcrR family transcriptional regulator [Mycobacterium marseillense]|jgi:AcrR family transcriptional regulator|uniref:TetR family transcriptional regulator n=1 Tax=Mycobacterium marseillense TaxID=701042 RepID=A0AAC9YP68_9MYCO|nr:TetR/AcrR family transcriptional regulator [Mycobacterium marseillense]ASW93146.1 TetR/AcrR family transcriptional regulator [Mycobacterium marseillense]MCV7407321.1 TetR/AcrR family transcriptional regulator [Mycobacterium marseillense]MDM3974465.1 TetR/AcrR family transcriptional regulator [Mycobacterium marseillense]ORA94106.1 TetR family transcriptional regulator [Mycobacterium marseillense]BBY11699.1 TetR family transcriptional regulator [Mycobacterium marseillense]
MQSPRSAPPAKSAAAGVREARRLETRARLFDAALSEIAQRGFAAADVSAIAASAGVVRGTFYFHFPTKEHVLIEAERNEETRIISELAGAKGDLASVLSQLVRHVLAAERRLGGIVFRDMLGLHFSSTRPVEDGVAQHPLAQFVAEVISRARDAGQVPAGSDPTELATFFLTGLFALLSTGAHDAALLSRYVTTIVKGMEKR